MAMTNEQLTKWIDEIFGTIDEIKQNSGDISGLTRSVKQLREDLTATQADVTDLEDQTAGTVSLPKAALQHFTDGSATQALDLIADIIPVQAGTGDPSPTNVRAITGYSSVTATAAGKNIFNENSSATYFIVNTQGIERAGFIIPIARGNYVVNPSNGNADTYIDIRTEKDGVFGEYTRIVDTTTTATAYITATEDCNLLIYEVSSNQPSVAEPRIRACDIQVEIGEEATTYEPYQANTATISLGSTVYSGTVDFATGDLYVDKASATVTEFSARVGANQFEAAISGMKNTAYSVEDALCDKMPYNVSSYGSASEYGFVTNNGKIICRLPDLAEDSLTAANAWLSSNNLQILYDLETPVTTTLTPAQLTLLQGENNVSATSGPITLTYAPDNVLAEVYAYIQKRFDTLTASLAAGRTTRKTTKTLTKKED